MRGSNNSLRNSLKEFDAGWLFLVVNNMKIPTIQLRTRHLKNILAWKVSLHQKFFNQFLSPFWYQLTGQFLLFSMITLILMLDDFFWTSCTWDSIISLANSKKQAFGNFFRINTISFWNWIKDHSLNWGTLLH